MPSAHGSCLGLDSTQPVGLAGRSGGGTAQGDPVPASWPILAEMLGVVVGGEHPYGLVEPVDVPLPVRQACVIGDESGVPASAGSESERERVGGLDGLTVRQNENPPAVVVSEDLLQGLGSPIE